MTAFLKMKSPSLKGRAFFCPLFLFREGLPETDRRANREACRPAAVLQQVVEKVVVDLVHLDAESEPPCGIPVEASAEAVETGPARLCTGRGESLDDKCGDRVGGVGRATSRIAPRSGRTKMVTGT